MIAAILYFSPTTPSQPQLPHNHPLPKISPLANDPVPPRRKFKARGHADAKGFASRLDHPLADGQRVGTGAGAEVIILNLTFLKYVIYK